MTAQQHHSSFKLKRTGVPDITLRKLTVKEHTIVVSDVQMIRDVQISIFYTTTHLMALEKLQ
jgi:hypothetical protein